jgi:hypothetical protein
MLGKHYSKVREFIMKRLLVGLMILTSFSSIAQNESSDSLSIKAYTCKDLYLREATRKTTVTNTEFKAMFASYGTASAVGLAWPPVGTAIIVAANAHFLNKTLVRPMIGTKEDRVLKNLLNESTKLFERLLRKARSIKPNITNDELGNMIEEGFNSGRFCRDNNLMSQGEIQRYILYMVGKL